MYSAVAASPPRRDFISVTLSPEEAVGVGGYNNSKAWRRRSCWRVRAAGRDAGSARGVPPAGGARASACAESPGSEGALTGSGALGCSTESQDGSRWEGSPSPPSSNPWHGQRRLPPDSNQDWKREMRFGLGAFAPCFTARRVSAVRCCSFSVERFRFCGKAECEKRHSWQSCVEVTLLSDWDREWAGRFSRGERLLLER